MKTIETENNKDKINVWDPFVRLFHWSLVIACIVTYSTQEENYELHVQVGYLLLGLLCFRILWGFIGPKHARFREFIFSPVIVIGYMRDIVNGRPQRFLGHNPAGGAMVLALLLTLLVIALSGIALDAAENRAGPLAGTRLHLYTDIINEIHTLFTHIAEVLVPLHLLGVLISSRVHRENLIGAMIHGRKRA